jgi:hypothetical protein
MPTEEIIIPPARMEEEEETREERHQRIGFAAPSQNDRAEPVSQKRGTDEATARVFEQLMMERQQILSDAKLSARNKIRLLESNRKTLVIVKGGSIRNTENVVYSILAFGGLVLVILSLLTVYKDLPKEVTLSFVGTVLGGTIATIAQKVGKL